MRSDIVDAYAEFYGDQSSILPYFWENSEWQIKCTI